MNYVDLEDAVWAHPDHRDDPHALRFAERRGLPLKFSPLIERGKLYVILPSLLQDPAWNFQRGGRVL